LAQEKTKNLVRAELSPKTPESVVEVLARAAELALAPQRPEPGSFEMRMMVSMPFGMGTVSISPRNLIRTNPFNPRSVRDIVATGGSIPLAIQVGLSQYFAFLLAFTVLLSRPVKREEALVLHKAWQVARFDGTFTLDDIVARADELREDYLLEKVGEADLRSYLNNLERAGALSATPSGYRLVERITAPFGLAPMAGARALLPAATIHAGRGRASR
jgi:hypothetical protein